MAVNSIKSMLQTVHLSSEASIYKVPVLLRSVDEAAYTPRMVSFGPLHYGKEELRDMEAHKRQYLKDFLARSPRIKLEDCIGVLKDLEDKALDCYAQTISLNSNDFIKLMLLDACFIIELFLKWRKRNSSGNSIDELIYNKFRMKYWMRFDLLLLENQLPFFVIEKLYDLYLSNNSDRDNVSLLVLTLEYFSYFGLDKKTVEGVVFKGSDSYKVNHILHLCLQCHLPTKARVSSDGDAELIPSATELQNAGIKFKKGRSACLWEVKFTNGMLEIPTVTISDSTNSRFRNLIALEQSGKDEATYFTNYVLLLDCLINTSSDVALLREFGIVTSFMGSDEEVSEMINKLCKGVITNQYGGYYRQLCESVNAY